MKLLPSFKNATTCLASFSVLCSTYIGAAEKQSSDIRQTPSDLSAPEMTCEKLAPGVRSKQFLKSDHSPDLYYSLYLPTDWTPDRKFPMIVEYPGNGPYSNRLGDTNSGRLEDCNLGYGITEGTGAIWICLPFVNPETNSHQLQWWGDVEATVQYCQEAVQQVIEKYNVDPEKIFLAGFSRGAIACNYIGLHNDEIASIWAGFICHSHYDGVRNWGYSGADSESALQRLQRLKNRPQWISHENSVAATQTYLEQTGLSPKVTYLSLPFPNHTDQWVLKDIPAREKLRAWWSQHSRSHSQALEVQNLSKAISEFQRKLITDGECLSNAIQVYHKNEIIYDQAIHSDFPGDQPIKDQTIFPIWSMTKPITCVAAMILHDRNQLQLDDPVHDVLPELKFLKVQETDSDPDSLIRPITFRDLFRHTSGIYGYDGSFDEEGTWKQIMKLENLDQVVELIAEQPLQHQPGARYTYGLSTAILGAAIEKISGQSLYEFMRENIFEPLGMQNTRFHLTPKDREHFQPLFVKTDQGYRPGTPTEDELYYVPGSGLQLGGEGLVSTMNDYGKFCRFLLNHGQSPNGKVILSQKSLDLMLSDQLGETPGFWGGENGYVQGFGFQILQSPEKSPTGAPAGIFGWGGYHTTHFWVDPQNELYVLFMTRRYPYNDQIEIKLQKTLYRLLHMNH